MDNLIIPLCINHDNRILVVSFQTEQAIFKRDVVHFQDAFSYFTEFSPLSYFFYFFSSLFTVFIVQ